MSLFPDATFQSSILLSLFIFLITMFIILLCVYYFEEATTLVLRTIWHYFNYWILKVEEGVVITSCLDDLNQYVIWCRMFYGHNTRQYNLL
jgi:hypothetical protein